MRLQRDLLCIFRSIIFLNTCTSKEHVRNEDLERYYRVLKRKCEVCAIGWICKPFPLKRMVHWDGDNNLKHSTIIKAALTLAKNN